MLKPSDYARCAGNPCFDYCQKCSRWVVNAPVPSESTRNVWIGVWVMEDERCPSYKETNADSKRTAV